MKPNTIASTNTFNNQATTGVEHTLSRRTSARGPQTRPINTVMHKSPNSLGPPRPAPGKPVAVEAGTPQPRARHPLVSMVLWPATVVAGMGRLVLRLWRWLWPKPQIAPGPGADAGGPVQALAEQKPDRFGARPRAQAPAPSLPTPPGALARSRSTPMGMAEALRLPETGRAALPNAVPLAPASGADEALVAALRHKLLTARATAGAAHARLNRETQRVADLTAAQSRAQEATAAQIQALAGLKEEIGALRQAYDVSERALQEARRTIQKLQSDQGRQLQQAQERAADAEARLEELELSYEADLEHAMGRLAPLTPPRDAQDARAFGAARQDSPDLPPDFVAVNTRPKPPGTRRSRTVSLGANAIG